MKKIIIFTLLIATSILSEEYVYAGRHSWRFQVGDGGISIQFGSHAPNNAEEIVRRCYRIYLVV